MMFLRKRSTNSTLSAFSLLSLLLVSTLGPRLVQGGDVLTTDGFSKCLESEDLVIDKMHITYDKAVGKVAFDVGGTSKKEQNVKAELVVTAYGREVYRKKFNPCVDGIELLCPVPKGRFVANDTLPIPAEYQGMIPGIAFQIPDLDGLARLELRSLDDDRPLACLESVVVNGKTASQPAVTYVTAGIAGAALVLSVLSTLGSGGASSSGPSPNFGDVMFWFQGVAMNGMLSVDYPPVYRSFAKNFAWSTGLIPFVQIQKGIDTFRSNTGGNTTVESVEYLLNATLVYTRPNQGMLQNKVRRDPSFDLFARQAPNVEFDANNTETKPEEQSKVMHYVDGIEAYVEQLKIPSANTFMTVLLVFCCVIAAIAVFILLFKVILELWALCASFPKSLTGFRKRYWGFLASTIVRIILILYGTWTLYCLFQFRRGDSWAAHVLAGLTLAVFTGILAFFVIRIWLLARKAKKQEGAPDALFEDKPVMRRYGLFYDQFKSNFWWVFVPLIIYAFTKAAFIALGEGHGLIQAAGQLGCEILLLVLLMWNRPFNTKAGNVLNIIISVVRVLSVVCLIVFVHELGIAADTKTVTGVALIVIQSTLTAVLALLLVINAIVVMCKQNPHDKRRKELEKQREVDNLTPLDARNSLFYRGNTPGAGLGPDGKGHYHNTPTQEYFPVDQHGGAGSQGIPMTHLDTHHSRQGSLGAPYRDHQRTPSGGTLSRQSLMASMVPPANAPNPYAYEEYRGAATIGRGH